MKQAMQEPCCRSKKGCVQALLSEISRLFLVFASLYWLFIHSRVDRSFSFSFPLNHIVIKELLNRHTVISLDVSSPQHRSCCVPCFGRPYIWFLRVMALSSSSSPGEAKCLNKPELDENQTKLPWCLCCSVSKTTPECLLLGMSRSPFFAPDPIPIIWFWQSADTDFSRSDLYAMH